MDVMEVDATVIARELPRDVIHNLYRHCGKWNMIRISHVCRLWRQTLHEYTGFWTDIDLHLGDRSLDLKAAYWLERSGQRPLTIDIWGGNLDIEEAPFLKEHSIVRLGIVLRGCMDRWQSFKIEVYSRRAIDILLPILAGYTPMLRYLRIEAIETDALVSVDAERPLIPLLAPIGQQGGAKLSVSIDSYIPRLTTIGPSITKLTVDGNHDTPWTSNDVLRMLQSCPNLINCDLYLPGSGEMGTPSESLESVSLLRLEELSIYFVPDIENILDALLLPALESLALGQVDWTTTAMSALWCVFVASRSLSSFTLTDESPGYDILTAPAPFHPFHADTLTLRALKDLEITGNAFIRPLLEHINFSDAETLHLTSTTFGVVYRLISSSAHLCDLSLSDVADIPTASTHSPVTLSALCTLRIQNCPKLLDYIHAPYLKSLHLLCPSRSTANSEAPLCALIERSTPALTALYLQTIDITNEEILGCLERLSHLEILSLNACAISDTVLRALAVPPSPGGGTEWLLPHLKVVQFHQNVNITPQGVIELFASRNTSAKFRIRGDVIFVEKPSGQDARALSHYSSSLSVAHSHSV
ncbi:hypothetical protein BOTBODRAFT_251550 [Botryobasidium botryosum FD-172 SS1]|uniref:F-box domain-containing protein n=1 Tax=Botryobasidium botryosum (strain FD-172 SS1) TaxID=930990 RepID=A0A067MP83_BOTB1|nr:hypothetical protein BOTBODRAFT_251550 [Botryobasidium botryosum FD-172 SS1]